MKELIKDIKISRLPKGFLYMRDLLNGELPFDCIIKDDDFSYFIINTYSKKVSIHQWNIITKMMMSFNHNKDEVYFIITDLIDTSIYSDYKQRWI